MNNTKQYELIEIVNGEVKVLPQKLQELKNMQQVKLMAEIREKELKEELLEAMEEYGIKNIQAEGFNATYVASTVRKGLDTKSFKEEQPELFELYKKESNTKAYVKVSFDD